MYPCHGCKTHTKFYARSEASAGRHLDSWPRAVVNYNKLEGTILQHLQKPSNLASFDLKDDILEDALVCNPVIPINSLCLKHTLASN
jgi:hypothetical protein